MADVDFFEAKLNRLKTVLHVTKDKEAGEALGLKEKAFNARKTRGSFPEKELRALAQQRPELGLDVDYVLTGVTEEESLRQRAALHAAAGISPVGRIAQLAEKDLVENYRTCTPAVQDALLTLVAHLATGVSQALTPDGRYPKVVEEPPRAVHSNRRKSL